MTGHTPPLTRPFRDLGKRFFEELDRDGDGRVRLEDLKLCMRCVLVSVPPFMLSLTLHFTSKSRRKLPERYAHEFMRRAKRGWFADSIGWEEFASLMHEREAFTLRAYNSLQLNRSGHLSVQAITNSLKRLDLPATEVRAARAPWESGVRLADMSPPPPSFPRRTRVRCSGT